MNTAEPRIHPIAWTYFEAPADVPWDPELGDGGQHSGQHLVEFAGRACYQSWHRPNPATATNEGYVKHILEVGHLSVLEHGTVTFYMTGISRALTHELIRHRHFSYSQLSQRFVDSSDVASVMPPIIAKDHVARGWYIRAMNETQNAYTGLVRRLTELSLTSELSSTALRKVIREAARAVLPNATETRIVVTGNYRAWRHFIGMRASIHADAEIRSAAIECLRQLQRIAPNIFNDFVIGTHVDGTEFADSKYFLPS